MSESAAPGQILVLVDGSAGSKSAASLAIEMAKNLGLPLAILGVSEGPGEEDSRIAQAVSESQTQARLILPLVEAIQATGEILEVARRRVLETSTTLVVLGANSRPEGSGQPVSARVWRMIKSLSPPVLVTPHGSRRIKQVLFCTGGERFIEEGARLTARLAASFSARVTVFHVSPSVPLMYGGRIAKEEDSPEEFLSSNSRLARNIRRQIELFRSAGVETTFHVAEGDVAPAVIHEIDRTACDLVVVGSSPARGAIRTYVLGDFARDIVARSGRSFLVVRSRLPGFWSELWRALKESAPEL